MAGTVTGGRLAAEANKERYGEDYYKRIGKLGGQKSRIGGFNTEKVGRDGLTGKERAIVAGRKGGLVRKKSKVEPVKVRVIA